MGKDSLIKSTTTKKPAAEEDKTQQVKKVSAKAEKTTPAKSELKPTKKRVAVKESAKKKRAEKTKTTSAGISKKTPGVTVKAAVKKPPKTHTDAKKPASTDPMPPPKKTPADPAEKMLYFGVAGLVILVLIVVIASWMNTKRYFVKSSDGAVSISQGKFAPKGAQHLISFPGLQLADPQKDTYTANEVFPIIYRYYLDKADMLLDVPGMPDFDGVKNYLNKSMAYATTREMKSVIKSRLDAISLMVLLYKADVAASKNSQKDLETAMGYLKEALTYQVDELESTRVKQKAEAVRTKLENLKSTPAKTAGGAEKK